MNKRAKASNDAVRLDAPHRCSKCRSKRAQMTDYQNLLGRIMRWECVDIDGCKRRRKKSATPTKGSAR